jgi:Flp pilus assembly protein CpaB
MRVRGAAVFLAMLLAFGATVAVFLYVKGVRRQATTTTGTVTVIVSKVDIPVGTPMDSLINQGAFTTRGMPQNALVQGVVTDLGQMRGKVAGYPILAGEQISTLRFQGTAGVAGGVLGIPDGYEAITLSLDPSRQVDGAITRGSRVQLFATYGARTFVLVPDVLILKAGSQVPGAPVSATVTMALKPADAEKVILAQENAKIWLGLLPPNQAGQQLPSVTVPPSAA